LQGRQIKVELLLGSALILILAGGVGALVRPDLEPDRTIESRFGDVSWNHEQHARMQEIVNCQVCHHKETQGTTQPKPCRHCHRLERDRDALILADIFMEKEEKREYKDENGPPPRNAFHGKCIGCHKAMKEGPVVCRDCHTQIFSGEHGTVQWDHLTHSRKMDMDCEDCNGNSCIKCHHKDTKALTDADYRPCSLCHEPAIAKGLKVATGIKGIGGPEGAARHEKALHGQCAVCHTENNPEEDLRSCKDCHESWVFDTEKKERPSIEQAIHMRCMECHNKEYAELEDSMPTACADCHRPDPSWLTGPEFGNVLWSHKRHGMYRDMTCDKCHHQDTPEEPHMACRRCHGTGLYENPAPEKAFEKRCIGCHKEKHTGLIRWDLLTTDKPTLEHYRIETDQGVFWWGHRSHAIGDSFSCQDCHHAILRENEQYVTAQRIKRSWPEEATRIQSCRKCHGSEGPVSGSVAEGTKAPALEKAFQKVCIECHVRLGGGPQTWDEYFEEPQIDDDNDEEAMG